MPWRLPLLASFGSMQRTHDRANGQRCHSRGRRRGAEQFVGSALTNRGGRPCSRRSTHRASQTTETYMQKICTALSSRAEGPSGGVGPSPCPGKMKPTPQQAHSQPQHAAAAATAAVAPSRHTRTRRGAQPNPPTNMTYHIFCAYLATARHASPARTHGDTAEFHALWSVWAEWNGPTARDRQQDNNTRVSLVNGSILGQGNNYVLW